MNNISRAFQKMNEFRERITTEDVMSKFSPEEVQDVEEEVVEVKKSAKKKTK